MKFFGIKNSTLFSSSEHFCSRSKHFEINCKISHRTGSHFRKTSFWSHFALSASPSDPQLLQTPTSSSPSRTAEGPLRDRRTRPTVRRQREPPSMQEAPREGENCGCFLFGFYFNENFFLRSPLFLARPQHLLSVSLPPPLPSLPARGLVRVCGSPPPLRTIRAGCKAAQLAMTFDPALGEPTVGGNWLLARNFLEILV